MKEQEAEVKDPKVQNLLEAFSFWRWFLTGSCGSQPGYRRICTWALVVHVSAGLILAKIVNAGIKEVSTAMILPVASILVGLTFSWAGNSQALLQTPELKRLDKVLPGGINAAACYYQLVILLVLVAASLWGLGSIGLFDQRSNIGGSSEYFLAKSAMFAFTSLTLRECWQVINATRHLLITRSAIEALDSDVHSKSGPR